MRRNIFSVTLLLMVGVFIFWLWSPSEKFAAHHPQDHARVEPTPVSPWRNSAADLSVLFPNATNHVIDSRIITGVMVQAQKQLGRPLNPDENPLRIFRALGPGGRVGSVLVTRVKAEYGGMEIVTGVDTNGAVRGVRIQSQRERPEVADAIVKASWLDGFVGKTATSELRLGADLAEVPAAARVSAQAVADGVRDQLIVLTLAELPLEVRESGRYIAP